MVKITKPLNLYDFDKTIYKGDSSIDFYLYSISKKRLLLKYLPFQAFHFILYILKIEPKRTFKGNFFIFVRDIKHLDAHAEDFWTYRIDRIHNWYKEKDHNSDVIVSASPSFLLEPIKNKYKIFKLIATELDVKTGRLVGENCYGSEKVNRITTELPGAQFESAYSDHKSDLPMLMLARKRYIVKGEEVTKI